MQSLEQKNLPLSASHMGLFVQFLLGLSGQIVLNQTLLPLLYLYSLISGL